MLLQQYDEKMRRWVLFGVGRVVARDGQSPLQQTITDKTKRLGFAISTGNTINKNKDRIFQTVACAVYESNWSKEVWNIALTLKKGEIVQFAGWLFESEYEDRATGKMKESQELRIEWLMPLKVVEKLVKGGTDNIPTKDNTGDGVSTNPNEKGIMF